MRTLAGKLVVAGPRLLRVFLSAIMHAQIITISLSQEEPYVLLKAAMGKVIFLMGQTHTDQEGEVRQLCILLRAVLIGLFFLLPEEVVGQVLQKV